MNSKKWIAFGVIFLVLGINLAFGLPRLTHFSAVDEPYWTFTRIPKFWTAVATQKWRSTNINDKPGITTAIITGPGLWLIDPLNVKSFLSNPKSLAMVREVLKVYASFRLPNYLLTLIGLFLIFFFIRKLLGERIALISAILIGLSPIILGISLVINPDSLLWIFISLSILSYLVHYQNKLPLDFPSKKPLSLGAYVRAFTRRKKYILFSGIFLGLALLTKYVANIVFIYFFALIFLRYILEKETKQSIDRYFKDNLLDFALVIIVSAAVFGALFPATWIHPNMILNGTIFSAAFKSVWPAFAAIAVSVLLDAIFLKGYLLHYPLDFLRKHANFFIRLGGILFMIIIVFVFFNTWLGMKFYDFQNILASPKSGKTFVIDPIRLSRDFFADFFALIFGLTPLAFLAILWAVCKNTLWKKISQKSIYIIYLFIFAVLYYLGSAVDGVADMVRYQISIYPLAMIIAAIGLDQAVDWLENSKYKIIAQPYIIYPVLIIISTWSLLGVRPYYFAYASSLLPQKYILNLKGIGDGSYEAAQYLNSLPNAKSLIIWSDKGAVCETFVGECITGFKEKDVHNVNFSYLVVSTDRGGRSMAMGSALNSYDLNKLYAPEAGDFKVILDGRPNNFVKVTSAASITKNKI